jgi:hypothetical protein
MSRRGRTSSVHPLTSASLAIRTGPGPLSPGQRPPVCGTPAQAQRPWAGGTSAEPLAPGSTASADAGQCTNRVLSSSAQADHSRASSQKRPSSTGQERGDRNREQHHRYAPTVPPRSAPGDRGNLPASTPGATAQDVADGTRCVIISTCYPPCAGTFLGRCSAMMTSRCPAPATRLQGPHCASVR